MLLQILLIVPSDSEAGVRPDPAPPGLKELGSDMGHTVCETPASLSWILRLKPN